ncbi:MAG: DUF4350 domain-containing protein, partial [Lysobacteraceae bacterium]
MSRRGDAIRIVLLLLLAAGLIAAFVVWWLHTYERVTETIDLPPRGEAAYNPLYALKTTLLKQGKKVSARQRLALDRHRLRPEDTLLMLGDPRMLSSSERDALLVWVERGGHLIISTPPPGVPIGESKVPLLSDFGMTPNESDSFWDENGCISLTKTAPKDKPRDEDTAEFCYGRRFTYYDEEAIAWDDEETGETLFARARRGKGSVDVLVNLDFVQNDLLDQGPHAAFVRQLLQPNYDAGGTFHLIYSAEMPSLWKLLFDYGWRVLLALALALIAWLWMRAQRFGPLQPSPSPDRRSLLEHVQASGDHLYRYGRSATLYAAVHDAFLRRLRRRDPYAAALEGPAQIEAIAKRTGLGRAEVEAALRYPRPR